MFNERALRVRGLWVFALGSLLLALGCGSSGSRTVRDDEAIGGGGGVGGIRVEAGEGGAEAGEGGQAEPGICSAPLDRSVATSFYEAARCLFDGPEAPQQGVDPKDIDPERVAIVRGIVRDEQGAALQGVRVSVLGAPEYGETRTRADGAYDLAVNGGGILSLRYDAEGRLPVQRRRLSEWRRFALFPDVVLIAESEDAAPVDLSANETVVVSGADVEDESGKRAVTVLFAPETRATLLMPNGKKQELESFQLRLTEYTVGERGPLAMPGQLPANSAYTYATEFGIDEAREAGAVRVEFEPKAVVYVTNFLEFPAGTRVPLGYYDVDTDAWQAADSGWVIDILGTNGTLAEIDSDGDGSADSEAELAAVGITGEELKVLAERFEAGDSLWRAALAHFSPWDCNWPFGPPDDAIDPNLGVDGAPESDCPSSYSGSIIGCEDQSLGEELPIAGTAWSLHYQSKRVPGRRDVNQLEIVLTGADIPGSLKRVELEVSVLGALTRKSFEPSNNLTYTFGWDGKDVYGRRWQGRQPVNVRLGYVYDGAYESTGRFGASGDGTRITGDASRQEITLTKEWSGWVGGIDAQSLGLGAWTLSPHHVYDPEGQALYYGYGKSRSAAHVGAVITTVAGTGEDGFSGDGGPAVQAQIARPHGVVVGDDGGVYVADELNHRIRKISPDGNISTFAGTGVEGFSGDDGPALEAELANPMGLAYGRDGTLFIADSVNARVRAIAPDGTIRTVAGGGDTRAPKDGSAIDALEVRFVTPHGLTLSEEGTLYIADSDGNAVFRLATDGKVSLVAGGGTSRADGVQALTASIDDPLGLAVSSAGDLFVTEWSRNKVRRIDASGVIWTAAGTGADGFSGDGGPAELAELSAPHTVDVGPDGSLYITDEGNERVRRVRPDGIIETFAGGGELTGGDIGDNRPPKEARFSLPRVVYVHRDRSVWVADYTDGRIRKIRPSLPGFTLGEILLASEDGAELYVFDSQGRHLRTLDAITNLPVLSFEYDAAGLKRIIDRDDNATTIERDGRGVPTALIGPFGTRTELTFGSDGYLSALRDAAGNTTFLSYGEGGLLKRLVEPRDAEHDVHEFAYDALGRLVRDASPSGYTQTLARKLDGSGISATLTTSLGRSIRVETRGGALGEATERFDTGSDGLVTKSTSNGSEQLIESPSGTQTRVTFSADPRFAMQAPYVSSLTLKTGSFPELTVTRELQAALSDPSDPTSLVSLTHSTTINRRTTTTTWNPAERTLTRVSPLGRKTLTTWDERGRIESVVLGDLEPQRAVYGLRGLLASTSAGARTTQFSHDGAGFLVGIEAPEGQSFAFAHDELGRVVSAVGPDQGETAFAFDPNGNLKAITTPGRTQHQFEYGVANLLHSYMPPEAAAEKTPTRFSYNSDQQVASIEHPDGSVTRFDYEVESGRPSAIDYGERAVSFTYDAKTGQLTSIDAPEQSVTYGYDGDLPISTRFTGAVAGQIALRYDSDFALSEERLLVGPAQQTIAYGYDDDGLLTQAGDQRLERNPTNGLIAETSTGSVRDEWTYDTHGDPVRYAAIVSSGAVAYSYEVTRDELGRVVRRTEVIEDETHTDEFEYEAGRLLSVIRDGETAGSYSYDANGNRTNQDDGTTRFDVQDRLERRGTTAYGYGPNGDLQRIDADGALTVLHYDAQGSLREVTLPDGRRIEYVTDGLGRRVQKKVDGAVQHGLIYRGDLRPIAELDAQGALRSVFVYASHPHVPDLVIREGITHRILSDQNGSVRLVFDIDAREVVQRLDYDAWGNVIRDTNPGFQPFGFAGGLYDPDTRLVRFGARDYDAAAGRFTAKDPSGVAGGINLYAYAANDPVNFVDVDGEVAILAPMAAGALSGAVFGAAVSAATQLATKGCINGWDLGKDALIGAAGGALGGGIAGAIMGRGAPLAGSIRGVNPLGGTTNCVNCVIATNATLSGSPASALLSSPQPISVLEKVLGGTFRKITGQAAIEANLLKAGPGAQGVVFGSRGPGQVGHVFNAINQNGVVRFLDGQAGGPASFQGFKELFYMAIP